MCGVNVEQMAGCASPSTDAYKGQCWEQIHQIILNCGIEETDEDMKELKRMYLVALDSTDALTKISTFLEWLLTKTVKDKLDPTIAKDKINLKCLIDRLLEDLRSKTDHDRKTAIENMVPDLMDLLHKHIPQRTIHFSA